MGKGHSGGCELLRMATIRVTLGARIELPVHAPPVGCFLGSQARDWGWNVEELEGCEGVEGREWGEGFEI